MIAKIISGGQRVVDVEPLGLFRPSLLDFQSRTSFQLSGLGHSSLHRAFGTGQGMLLTPQKSIDPDLGLLYL
jgi:hypothetical protein